MSNGLETKAAVERVQFLETILQRLRTAHRLGSDMGHPGLLTATAHALAHARAELDHCIGAGGAHVLHGRGP